MSTAQWHNRKYTSTKGDSERRVQGQKGGKGQDRVMGYVWHETRMGDEFGGRWGLERGHMEERRQWVASKKIYDICVKMKGLNEISYFV